MLPGRLNEQFFRKMLILLTAIAILGIITPSVLGEEEENEPLLVNYGPDSYDSIWDAVWDAEENDTILVGPGVYEESFTINKRVKIIGTGHLSSVLTPDEGTGLTISSDWVYIEGMGFEGNSSQTALDVEDVEHFEIKHSRIEGFGYGIDLELVSESKIENISFLNNEVSLRDNYSVNLTLSKNLVMFSDAGFSFVNSTGAFLLKNEIYDNERFSTGFRDCNNTRVHGNYLGRTGVGLGLINSSNAEVFYNIITECSTALNISGNSTNVTVYLTEISHSEIGLAVWNCTGNLMVKNNFVSNTVHAFDNGNNSYNLTRTGNYWEGLDTEQDDVNFEIDGGDNIDHFPLDEPVVIKMPDPPKEEEESQLTALLLSLPSLAAAVLSIVLGVYVFTRNRKTPSNQVFLILMSGAFIWGFGEFFHRLTDANAVFLLSNLGLILIPPSLFHFTFVYPTDMLSDKKWRFAFYGVYAPGVILAVMMLLLGPKLLILLGIILYFFLFVIIALLRIILIYLGAKENIIKIQAMYLVIGLLIILLIISMELVITAPWFINVADSLIIFFIALFFTIAVLRYRLVDVEIIFKKSAFYSIMSVILGGIFMVFTETMEAIFAQITTGTLSALQEIPDQGISLIAAGLVVLALTPVRSVTKRVLDKVFPQSRKFEKEYLERLEAYEQTLRGMWADGYISERETEALSILRKKLDLNQHDHEEITEKIRKEGKRAPPPPPTD